jgi:hypothetical protein
MLNYLRLSRRDILQRLFASAKTPLLVLGNILHNYIIDRGSDKLYKSIRIDSYIPPKSPFAKGDLSLRFNILCTVGILSLDPAKFSRSRILQSDKIG